MQPVRLSATLLLSLGICANAQASSANLKTGDHNLYAHEAGNVPPDTYQYSLYLPKQFHEQPAHVGWPVVIFLHEGEMKLPQHGTRNMTGTRLSENKPWTAPGYSGNIPSSFGRLGYLHVAPIKEGKQWEADKLKRLVDHVKTQVPNIQADRIYVVGYGMGGQGAWQLASAGARIAAIMPIGARSCEEVKRGTSPATCLTAKTPVWAHHNPTDPNSKFSEHTALYQSHLDGEGYGRFTINPGTMLDWPANSDWRNLDVRLEWLLSQSCGTPPNYFVQMDGGIILEFVSGQNGAIGDNSRRGYFEAGSVIRVTAPKTRDGKPFVKWASPTGNFADPAARTATFTTAAGDTQITAIYGTEPVKLTAVGGTFKPAAPQPGETVIVTADTASDASHILYWTTGEGIDIANPCQRSFTFAMPSRDVTFTAKSNAAE